MTQRASEPEHHDPRRDAVAAAAHAPTAGAAFSEALGGPLGIVESALPAAAFVLAYTVGRMAPTDAALVAVAIGALMAASRLARRQTLQFALSGLFGIAIAAFVVSRTGKAEDFFLPGLLVNGAYVVALVVSIVVRWPIAGVALGVVTGTGSSWRADPAHVRLYARVTAVWAVVFGSRLAVQLPLYLAGAVVALGIARVAMGLPLMAVAMWLSWLLLRHQRMLPPAADRQRGATLGS